ncbi:MAG TPA: type II toxin-antitoxin system VapC family toxin [Beijerinckiaceae bacterium]|nr:type II toxin-antitoxin system VapC family toxin [Beijerinckiaceae bacterium]
MFIDSSALVSLLAREPDRLRIVSAIDSATVRRTTPLVRLETAMVLSTLLNLDPEAASAAITAALDEADVEVVPITDEIARAAVTAFARYGKGRGHPARLNLADCLIYAAAKSADAPLLFIGDDFSRTDVASVLDDPRPTAP